MTSAYDSTAMKTSLWQYHTQLQCWLLGNSYIVLLLVQTDQRQWSSTQPALDASGWIQETAQPANSGPHGPMQGLHIYF